MPDLCISTPLEKALKQLREDLACVNASILSLECVEARGTLGRKQRGLVKNGKEKAVRREHSLPVNPKQPTIPLAEGYAEVHLATQWSPEAESWVAFMRQIIRLPIWMLPVVQHVIRRRAWRKAADPLEQIRAASNREAARIGLRGE
jgi:hypothetical protein